MLIMRLILVVVALMLVVNGALYILTRNRRYLQFAWRTVRVTVLLLLLFALLFILERYVLVAWQVLL